MIIWESLATVVGLALLAALAVHFGADSRDGITDPPQPPLGSSRRPGVRRRLP
jgi:hypothetical protein